MSVIVTALFPTKVEASDNFYDTLVSVLPETRAYDGCIGVTPHRDLDDASRILLIEGVSELNEEFEPAALEHERAARAQVERAKALESIHVIRAGDELRTDDR